MLSRFSSFFIHNVRDRLLGLQTPLAKQNDLSTDEFVGTVLDL